jgi:hypothetical protein
VDLHRAMIDLSMFDPYSTGSLYVTPDLPSCYSVYTVLNFGRFGYLCLAMSCQTSGPLSKVSLHASGYHVSANGNKGRAKSGANLLGAKPPAEVVIFLSSQSTMTKCRVKEIGSQDGVKDEAQREEGGGS